MCFDDLVQPTHNQSSTVGVHWKTYQLLSEADYVMIPAEYEVFQADYVSVKLWT